MSILFNHILRNGEPFDALSETDKLFITNKIELLKKAGLEDFLSTYFSQHPERNLVLSSTTSDNHNLPDDVLNNILQAFLPRRRYYNI